MYRLILESKIKADLFKARSQTADLLVNESIYLRYSLTASFSSKLRLKLVSRKNSTSYYSLPSFLFSIPSICVDCFNLLVLEANPRIHNSPPKPLILSQNAQTNQSPRLPSSPHSSSPSRLCPCTFTLPGPPHVTRKMSLLLCHLLNSLHLWRPRTARFCQTPRFLRRDC